MGFDRRGFIKLLAGGAVGTLATPLPWKMADDISIWTQNWPWIPTVKKRGEKLRVPTICKLCTSVCALSIETVGGVPITSNGNQDSPLSNGGICPIGAAAVRLLYSPSRVRGPMKRTGNGFEPISWDDAKKELADALDRARGNVALITGDEAGSGTEVLTAFVNQMGSKKYFTMPSDTETASVAWNQLIGGTGQVGFDLENADYVLMIGADVFETWGPTVRNRKLFAAHRENEDAKFVFVGPVENGTAAISDTWIPSLPSKQGVIALGLAYHLFRSGAVSGGGLDDLKEFVLAEYAPKRVEQEAGISAAELGRLAKELIQAKKPLVIVGSEFGAGMGAHDYAAGLALNVLLNRVNQSGGMRVIQQVDPVVSGAPTSAELYSNDLIAFLDSMARETVKRPEVLLVYEANPVYGLPHSERMSKVMEQIPFKVSFSTFMDETAAMSDLILPSSLCLERLDDAYSPFGIEKALYTIGEPVIEPIYDTRNIPDFILELAGEMGVDLGFSSYEEVLQAKASSLGAKYKSLVGGEVWTSDQTVGVDTNGLFQKSLRTGFGTKDSNGAFPVALAPMAKANVGTDRVATPGIALDTIQADELQGKEFYVKINGVTAGKYGLTQDNRIKLVSPVDEITARVNIDEGVMSDVVAAPLGFGRSAWDVYSRDKGENVYQLMTVKSEPGTGMMVFADTRVKITKI
ncbi:MAG: menaquinone reductase molybdopterin-binding-like subunit QrcB [Desulfovibrionales bacterium]